MRYEKDYHFYAHKYLLEDPFYYFLRSRLALSRYFSHFKNISSKKILDFGCGLGQNIFLLKKNSTGFDISQFSLDFCEKKGIPIINSETKLPSDFDIIISSHVFEHLDDPLEKLTLLFHKLKPNGNLVLIIPKLPHRKSSLYPNKADYELFAWNFRTMNNLLDRAGFKVLSNRVYYGKGYFKLSRVAKINFRLYKILITLAGVLFRGGELLFIAEKIKSR